ncbi:Trm112 family protein [uncultured Parasutterella sp.]|uniref:Trm112 family protein n=1 Tax=uncultured Parasutterella sp. TaxID=1263098 RepID=UPI0025B52D9D|nr:Trm112 family protein [uncultured Parasutterella sp.]
MDPKITEILVCPICKGPLRWNKDIKAFPVVDDIPAMVPSEARDMTEEEVEKLEKK